MGEICKKKSFPRPGSVGFGVGDPRVNLAIFCVNNVISDGIIVTKLGLGTLSL